MEVTRNNLMSCLEEYNLPDDVLSIIMALKVEATCYRYLRNRMDVPYDYHVGEAINFLNTVYLKISPDGIQCYRTPFVKRDDNEVIVQLEVQE